MFNMDSIIFFVKRTFFEHNECTSRWYVTRAADSRLKMISGDGGGMISGADVGHTWSNMASKSTPRPYMRIGFVFRPTEC